MHIEGKIALYTSGWTHSDHICPDCFTTIQGTVSALNTSLFPAWKKAETALSDSFSDGLWRLAEGELWRISAWHGQLERRSVRTTGLSSVSTVVKNSSPEGVRWQKNKQTKNTTAFMHFETDLCHWLQLQNCCHEKKTIAWLPIFFWTRSTPTVHWYLMTASFFCETNSTNELPTDYVTHNSCKRTKM